PPALDRIPPLFHPIPFFFDPSGRRRFEPGRRNGGLFPGGGRKMKILENHNEKRDERDRIDDAVDEDREGQVFFQLIGGGQRHPGEEVKKADDQPRAVRRREEDRLQGRREKSGVARLQRIIKEAAEVNLLQHRNGGKPGQNQEEGEEAVRPGGRQRRVIGHLQLLVENLFEQEMGEADQEIDPEGDGQGGEEHRHPLLGGGRPKEGPEAPLFANVQGIEEENQIESDQREKGDAALKPGPRRKVEGADQSGNGDDQEGKRKSDEDLPKRHGGNVQRRVRRAARPAGPRRGTIRALLHSFQPDLLRN